MPAGAKKVIRMPVAGFGVEREARRGQGPVHIPLAAEPPGTLFLSYTIRFFLKLIMALFLLLAFVCIYL